MFKLLGSGDGSEIPKKREEEVLSKKLEELTKENELLKKQISELTLNFQREIANREKVAFERGIKAGKEEILKEFGNLLSVLSQNLQEAQTSYEEALRSSRELIVELVFEVVNKLLPEIRKNSVEVALTSIKEIISSFLTSSSGVKIVYLSPEDYEKFKGLLRSHPDLEKLEKSFQLIFEQDPELSPGDVVVKTEAIDVDGRLRTKLEELKKYLLENLNV
jgi:flagellar biosynthesis/type III secretory pathway protein FliH